MLLCNIYSNSDYRSEARNRNVFYARNLREFKSHSTKRDQYITIINIVNLICYRIIYSEETAYTDQIFSD